MRASPAFQVTLWRFGVWRGAVVGVAGLGAALLGAWWATRESRFDGVLLASLAIGAATLAWLVVSLLRVPAAGLRWDGRVWHLGDPAASVDAVSSGDLFVAIDLGAWMLLRFRRDAAAGRRRDTWLPVQRRGLEPQWHALRCAVYAPRPLPRADAPSGR